MPFNSLSPSFQHPRKFFTLKSVNPFTITQCRLIILCQPSQKSFRIPYNRWRDFVFSATRAADKITGMKKLVESLTRKADDEIFDKKLEKNA
jgi:hypothetical protein